MNKKIIQMIKYLQQNNNWVRAGKIAAYLGVSERQVRNYMTIVTENGYQIESSEKGYRLIPGESKLSDLGNSWENPGNRQKLLLTELLFAKTSRDLYDLADMFFISVSTLETDLQKLRRTIREYNLSIDRNRDSIVLRGEEIEKRKLLCNDFYIENRNEYLMYRTSFITMQNQEIQLRKWVRETLLEHGLFANDYALGNIALYIAVAAERISAGFIIEEDDKKYSLLGDHGHLRNVTKELSCLLSSQFKLELNNAEQYFLQEILEQQTASINTLKITRENLNEYIEETYCSMTRDIIKHVEDFYHITCSNESFYVKFTLHIRNIFLHKTVGFFTKKTLDDNVKTTYPLAYDIAVFIGQLLKDNYGREVSDDDITCIAFHICNWIYDYKKERLSVTLVYEAYHDFYQKTASMISQTFQEELELKHVVSVSDYLPDVYDADLIISTVDVNLSRPSVLIHAFPTKKDFEDVRQAIVRLRNDKEYNIYTTVFRKYFQRDFFMRCCGNTDSFALIQNMCNQVIQHGFAPPDFTEQVLKREQMADTIFGNIAMPHALSFNTLQSFIAVAVNDIPISWGKDGKQVRLCMLVGVNKNDRKTFGQVLDFLIEIVSDAANVAKLEKAQTYDEFLQLFMEAGREILT